MKEFTVILKQFQKLEFLLLYIIFKVVQEEILKLLY